MQISYWAVQRLKSKVDRTRSSSPRYEEGEGDSKEVEDNTKLPKALQDVRRRALEFEVDDWVYLKFNQ